MRKKIIIPFLIVATFFTSIISVPAFAAEPSAKATIRAKAAYEGLYQCFVGGAYKDVFKASDGGKGMLLNSLSNDTVKLPYGLTDAGDNNTDCKQILKGFNDNSRSDDNLNKGLMQAGIWDSTDITKVKNFFAGTNGNGGNGTMGYKAEQSGNVDSGQTTYQLVITFNTDRLTDESCNQKSGTMAVKGRKYFYTSAGGGGETNTIVFPTITQDNTGNWFFGDAAASADGANVPMPGSGDAAMFYFCNDNSYIQIQDSGSQSSPYYNISIYHETYIPDAWGGVSASGSSYGFPAEIVTGGKNGYNYTANTGLFRGENKTDTVKDTGKFDDYTLDYIDGTAAMVPVSTIAKTNNAGYSLNVSSYNDLALSEKEVIGLYTYYISDVLKYPVVCEGEQDYSLYADAPSIHWTPGKDCRIYTGSTTAQSVSNLYGVDNATLHFTKAITIDDIIDFLKSDAADTSKINQEEAERQCREQIESKRTEAQAIIDSTDAWAMSGKENARKLIEAIDAALTANGNKYAKQDGSFQCIEIEGVDTSVDLGDDDNGNTDKGTVEKDKEQAAAADNMSCYNSTSLGWILCPVIDIMSSAVQQIYGVVEGFLEIDTTVIGNTGEDKGTYSGWKAFQNFANIAVIILLLVVIFSQVTGVGIDNYGIKKTLPKLIIAAVLVNLSFIVCQSAVDLSNIFGVNLKSLFEGMATGFDPEATSIRHFASSLATTLVTGGLITAGGFALAFTWELWLIPLILALLGVLISIIFFFIILAVRKALVIVFVVVAPLAFACYMLPNTKKWFDKWLKIFCALILVYPICGLLMGAGTYVSSLLLNSVGDQGGFLFYLVAMLMRVIPFFFIPTILKGSMRGIGGLGARISGVGAKLGGGIKKTVGGAQMTKDMQRQFGLTADKQRARRLAGISNRLGKPQFMQRRLGAVNQRIAAANAANSKETAWADEGRMRANEEALRTKETEDAIADEMSIIKADPGFNSEDGEALYTMYKAAIDANNRRRANAIIDLAGQNGKAASQFQEQLRKETNTKYFDRDSAMRMVNGAGKGVFKATDGVAFQYAREVYGGKTTENAATWTNKAENIAKAIDKNINNAEAYASQSKSVHQLLGDRKGDIAAFSSADIDGASLVRELEYAAAEAAANNKDASKAKEFERMRTITPADPMTGAPAVLRQTHSVEAQEAQTAAQITAATAQATATANAARQQFESSHVTNAELKRAHAPKGKKPTFYEAPEGFTHIGGQIYQDGTGRKYDARKNKFFS